MRGCTHTTLRIVQAKNDQIRANSNRDFDDLVCFGSMLNPAIRLAPQFCARRHQARSRRIVDSTYCSA